MLFKRRKNADFWERARTLVWPRRSVWRSAQYFAKRALRLRATPHAIAAGIAAGVFASFTPFLGFHFALAAGLAWLIGGNMIASAFGTAFGNPLTFPFIWGATYKLGQLILHGVHPDDVSPMHLGRVLWHMEFWDLWEPFLKPMAIGAVPLGLGAGIIFYVLTRWSVIAFREQRRKRLEERARRLASAKSADIKATAG